MLSVHYPIRTSSSSSSSKKRQREEATVKHDSIVIAYNLYALFLIAAGFRSKMARKIVMPKYIHTPYNVNELSLYINTRTGINTVQCTSTLIAGKIKISLIWNFP